MTQNTKVRKAQATKIVVILAAYIFTHINRVCFIVLSSDGTTRYNTCFTNGQASCTCDGNAIWHKECCHIKQLAPLAAEKLAARMKKVAEVDAGPFCYTGHIDDCRTCGGNHNTYHHAWAVMSMDERQAEIDRVNADKRIDEEYEAWKAANGLVAMSRNEYIQAYAIYE